MTSNSSSSASLKTALDNESTSTSVPASSQTAKEEHDQQASVQFDFEVDGQFYTLQVDHNFKTSSSRARINPVQLSINGRRAWRRSRRLILKARAAEQLISSTILTSKPADKKTDRVAKRNKKKRSGGRHK